ncbi:MAG: TonB-dependent receptor [Polyangiales bacterium]
MAATPDAGVADAAADSVAATGTANDGYSARAEVPTDSEAGQATRAALRGRSTSTVHARQLEEQLPRSAPDALRFIPGVSIQQTAHGQASPYVRGMTGQQVLHLFDGVRLNNGIYRQGPNQYFFTVDARTLQSLTVLRGSASTRYGSDALGGAILAAPRQTPLELGRPKALRWHPRLVSRYGSADRELGGRAESGVNVGEHTSVLFGGGYRDVGQLQSGGVVQNPGAPVPEVPRFAADGRTQRGTGFREGSFDVRVVHAARPALRWVSAAYGYLQRDAPRTDQCPPPEAPSGECLRFVRQDRTLVYSALRGRAGAMEELDLVLSYQRHAEARQRDRPRSGVRFDWQDHIDTLGLALKAASPWASLGAWGEGRLRYGLDGYQDLLQSRAEQRFTDIDRAFRLSRGQYLDGSRYLQLGLFAEAQWRLLSWLTLWGGGRGAWVDARTPADPESGSSGVDKTWSVAVGRAGATLALHPTLALLFNLNQGFRAPNLDDLSARQQVGPGFQFENPDLQPERTLSYELGLRGRWPWLSVETWAFATTLQDAIVRALRDVADCPPATPQCPASRQQFQLINAVGEARILGAEGGLTFYLPWDFTLRQTLAYAWGEAPNVTAARIGSRQPAQVPLSRIPPLNGNAEARWRHVDTGLYVAGVLRWAAAQRRLAPSDLSDARIPIGGTPGYAVLDLRAGWRWQTAPRLRLSLVLENLTDAAYRVHGSSINGAGRGIVLELGAGL